MMIQRMRKKRSRQQGFSLIEVLIGVFLMAVAVLGLAELYLLGIMNNLRSSDIANALFLAQQQVDYLRTLESGELSTFPSASRGESNDEQIDVNADGTPDYRRITVITNLNPTFNVEVLVFPPSQFQTAQALLIANPDQYRVRAHVETVISR
jgi:prepilin-type N-terminal cleavage/methylation domain-containing protein